MQTAPRRTLRLLSAIAMAAAFLLALMVSPASAVDIGHSYSFSFEGSGTNALSTGITSADVDNSAGPSAGDVYVTDATEHRVEKFDSAGNFILMFGDNVNATTGEDVCTAASGDTCKAGNSGTSPEQLENPLFLAVDQSAGPSAGDIYVADVNQKKVHKYDPDGNLVTAWGSGGVLDGSAATNGPFSSIYGIDVDSSGSLFVFQTSGTRIFKFAQDGTFVTTFTTARGNAQSGLAWSPAGYLFKSNGNGDMQRSNLTGGESVQISLNFPAIKGFNVDSSTGTEYSVQHNGADVAEYKFDGFGQPLDAQNVPCAKVLAEFAEGCPPTHEFGGGNLTEGKGIGVNAATNKTYVADRGNHEVDVFIAALAPLPITEDPIANTTVSGTVKPDGAGDVVECYFEFGLSAPAYGSKEDCSPAPPYENDQAVTATLPGLLGEETYHYRLVAKNVSGATNYGFDKTITPHNVKGLKTEAATDVTRTSAELHASYEGNGEPTTYYFEWGTSTSYGNTSAPPPGDPVPGGSPTFPPLTELSFTPTGLEPETKYHFRVVAENGIGISPGKDMIFETLPAVQNLTTISPENVARRSVSMRGEYDGDGDATSYYFQYGKTTSYSTNTIVKNVEGNPVGATIVETDVTGLDLETTYHYRIVATNSLGTTTRGPDQMFTTLPAVGGVVTKDATDITQDGITLNGEFVGNGEDTHFYFEYGLTTKYGKTAPVPPGKDAGSPVGATPISTVISDYEAYSTYHYRVVASNDVGATQGEDKTFQTLPAELPEISGTKASDVSQTAARLEAEINPNRWATVYLFEYGPGTSYGESTEISQSIGSDQAGHSVSASVANLVPGTQYHFRAVAINFTGTIYGSDQVFATPDAPRIDLTSSSAIGTSSAHLSASVSPNSATTNVRFEYGPTAAYGASTPETPIGSDAAIHVASADIGGLVPGTAYHFRTVAANAFGITRGPDQTFTTLAAVPVETRPPRCRKGFARRRGKCVRKRRRRSCRKGFVRRHRKCVKRKHRHRKHRRNSTRRHG